jgi:SAM-dependent methyltransferase
VAVELERTWRRRRLIPALYDLAVEREGLARPAGRLLWGADVRPLYEAFDLPRRLPPGSAVLDVPCGGGVAFRGLAPGADLRYVAADLSPEMLARARTQARRRGLDVSFARAGVEQLPFPSATFDLCVTYNGLHCFPDPAAALSEMARVLKPGATLRGSAVIAGAGARQDAAIAFFRYVGAFGRPCGEAELRGLLGAAGLEKAEVRASGALAFFTARKPDRPPGGS